MKYPVSGGAIVKKDSLIYIFGGYSDSLQSEVDFIQEYSPATNNWRIVGHLNEKRYGLAAVNYGDSVLIFGGVKRKSPRQSALEIWNFKTSPVVNASNGVFNKSFSDAVVFNGKLYIIGGVPEGIPVDSVKPHFITEYSVPTSSVNSVIDTIFTSDQLSQQMCAVLNNDIYILGGAYNGILKNAFTYTPSTRKVTQLTHMLMLPRAAGSVVTLNGNTLYLVGGFNESNHSMRQTEIYTTTTGGMSRAGGDLDHPRSACMTIVFGSYIYVFGGVDDGGQVEHSIERISISDMTDINDKTPQIAKGLELLGNYPNPFNPSTVIRYRIPYSQNISISLYDITGRELATLENEYKIAGEHSTNFDATFYPQISSLVSGVYFYRIRGEQIVKTGKMILMR